MCIKQKQYEKSLRCAKMFYLFFLLSTNPLYIALGKQSQHEQKNIYLYYKETIADGFIIIL